MRKTKPRRKIAAQTQSYWIAKAHAARANNPKKQAKIDAQARQLLCERVAAFGEDWHINCAIRLPADLRVAVDKHGPGVMLRVLDKDASEKEF